LGSFDNGIPQLWQCGPLGLNMVAASPFVFLQDKISSLNDVSMIMLQAAGQINKN
jgi:hypothetical protein